MLDASVWEAYPRHRISPEQPQLLRHADVTQLLRRLQTSSPQALHVRQLGRSVEGRSIQRVRIGSGPRKVLLWSQMHGDEPTHTAVLLDLLSFLQSEPSHGCAQAILAGCTLDIIPMLNPDGAECFTRRNAQGIDINRDARRLQTPEGKILHTAQEEWRPHFGFNLHDQNERTVVGRTHKLAAVSLMVPPLDDDAADSENTLKAKKVASCFLQAVSPYCPTMVARYDAQYTPHAFGESMQQSGVTTVLVEVGGWPGRDLTDLLRTHFVGLVACLHAIATDAYLNADPALYQDLPLSATQPLVDLLLSKVTVVNGLGHRPFVADVGVCVAGRKSRPVAEPAAGIIADLGDLERVGAAAIIDGQSLVCVPGLIHHDPRVTPRNLPSERQFQQWVRAGVTTVIGRAALQNPAEMDGLDTIRARGRPMINVGFVGSCAPIAQPPSDPECTRLDGAEAGGVLAVAIGPGDSEVAQVVTRSGATVIATEDLCCQDLSNTIANDQLTGAAEQRADRLRLSGRGVIRPGAVADLLLLQCDSGWQDRGFLKLADLQYVLVGGVVVFAQGRFAGAAAGAYLTRPTAAANAQQPTLNSTTDINTK